MLLDSTVWKELTFDYLYYRSSYYKQKSLKLGSGHVIKAQQYILEKSINKVMKFISQGDDLYIFKKFIDMVYYETCDWDVNGVWKDNMKPEVLQEFFNSTINFNARLLTLKEKIKELLIADMNSDYDPTEEPAPIK